MKAPMKYVIVTGGERFRLHHVFPSIPTLNVCSYERTSLARGFVLSLVSGVVSGLGKGVTASSIGVLLKAGGWRVTNIKIDPYINIDAGTMSPFEHGEVFVLDDGGEADLDLGNYERFVDSTLTRDHNITTGKIYQTVIAKERKGEYLGKTVQVSPSRISHCAFISQQ